MIWRLNFDVIIIPSITLVGTIGNAVAYTLKKGLMITLVGAAGFITAQHRVDVHTSIFSLTVTRWTEAFLSCSLVTTGLCTRK